MSFVIGAVTLPRFPRQIRFRKQADIKELRYPSNRAIIIVYGGKADHLVIEGTLQASGQTMANLYTNYVGPLELLMYTEVVVQNTGRSYHNTSFVMVDFEYEERPGLARAIQYKMEFIRGEIHIVI